jgi:hypothetical protein
MKITRRQLSRLIKEEITKMSEATDSKPWAWERYADERPRNPMERAYAKRETEPMPDIEPGPSAEQNDYELGRKLGRKGTPVPEEYDGNLDFLTGYSQGMDDAMAPKSRPGLQDSTHSQKLSTEQRIRRIIHQALHEDDGISKEEWAAETKRWRELDAKRAAVTPEQRKAEEEKWVNQAVEDLIAKGYDAQEAYEMVIGGRGRL